MINPWKIPWLTWIMHFVISGLATFVQIQFDADPWRAASYPIVFYVAREVDQLLRKLYKKIIDKEVVTFNWLDIGFDALSAILGAVLAIIIT